MLQGTIHVVGDFSSSWPSMSSVFGISPYQRTSSCCTGMVYVQRRLEGITCTILSNDVTLKSRAERSNIAAPRVILCKFSGFLK